MANTAGVNENCTFCGRPLYHNDETVAGFSGGGIVDLSQDKTSKTLQAFCKVLWRSPYSRGEGGKLETTSLIDGYSDDQFEIYFCSTSCVRSYLNSKVDKLEQKVANWYEEQMEYLLREKGREVAVAEWQRYFGTPLEEAERAIVAIENRSSPD